MEDGVYVSSWSRSRDGFTLWVKSRPRIRASAPTYDEAEERLIEAIQDNGGATVAVLEFDPPLPKSRRDGKYSSPEIYLIGGDERFETDAPRWKWSESAQEKEERLRWLDGFYEKPVCRNYKYTSNRRSDRPVTLAYAGGRYDGAFGCLGTDGGPSHQIVSEEFLALLTKGEKRGLEFQPTILKGRRKFFELVGPEGAPHVGVRGINSSGRRCAQCHHWTWGLGIKEMAIQSFVARSDLPGDLPGVFTVGTFPEVEPAVTGVRWKDIVGRKGTRGFVSRLLGVVADHEVLRHR
jgi:hypothetical protein